MEIIYEKRILNCLRVQKLSKTNLKSYKKLILKFDKTKEIAFRKHGQIWRAPFLWKILERTSKNIISQIKLSSKKGGWSRKKPAYSNLLNSKRWIELWKIKPFHEINFLEKAP